MVSTEGLLNHELAAACEDPQVVADGDAKILDKNKSTTLYLENVGAVLSVV